MMKDLINNIVSFYKAGILAGRIRNATVLKGLHEDPALIPYNGFPFICVDDGGQRVDTSKANSDTAQVRIYTVILEFGTYVLDKALALDTMLDFIDECKAELELETNRQLDGHAWGISVRAFSWSGDNKFFRASQVMIEFFELEDKYNEF